MKKLKVEYNDFPSHSEEYGYVEGCAGAHGREVVLVYFPETNELKFCDVYKLTPIGYEEV